jgi:O-antigen ligase
MNPPCLEQLAPGIQEGTTEPESASSARPPAAWLVTGAMALFAVGISTDNLLVRYLGSSAVMGVPLAMGAAWHVLTTGRMRRAPAPLLWLTAFAAWSFLTVFWAQDFAYTAIVVRTRVMLLALVWMSWQALGARRNVRAMLYGYLAGCAIVVAESWRVYRSDAGVVEYVRYYAEGFNPNQLSVTLALGIPMAAYLARSGTRRANLLLLYLPVALIGISLSASRSGAVTAAVAIAAVLVWMVAHSRASLPWALALIIGGVAAALAWVPEQSFERILRLRAELESGSVGDRGEIWRAGLRVFAANPLAGVGIGSFPAAVAPILGFQAVAHNTPLSVATESGVIGLLLLLAVPASLVWTTRRKAGNERAFVIASILTWFVGTSAATWEEHKQTWFVFLIGAALCALAGAPGRPGRGEGAGPASEA